MAWRWKHYALVVLERGLLVATVLVLMGRSTVLRPVADALLGAAVAASTAAVVLAQAMPAV